MNQHKFHLKVKPVVDRILLFHNNELISEMFEVVDETGVNEKIFNGYINLDKESLNQGMDAVFLCYCLGEDFMEANTVFSLPFQTQPDDITSEYAPNSICVNYYLPKNDNVLNNNIAKANFCLLDISERLQKGLGLPALIILPVTILSDNLKSIGVDELKKRGIDIKAEGFFFKKIAHLWAKNNSDIADYNDEKIKISLFAHSVTQHIELDV